MLPLTLLWLLAGVTLAVPAVTETEDGESSSFRRSEQSREDRSNNNVHAPDDASNRKERVCLTKSCVLSSAVFLENMDASRDPCQDFYQYACGGYESRVAIPEDKTSLSQFQDVDDKLSHKLRALLEAPVDEDKDIAPIVKAKDVYASCINTDLLERLGTKPIELVLNKLGGWPVLEGRVWASNRVLPTWSLETVMGSAAADGISMNAIVSIGVTVDLKNSSAHVLELDQPSLGMPDRSYLLKGPQDKLVKAYFALMVESAVYMGANRTFAEQDLRDMLDFEIKIANLTLPKEERRNFTQMYNRMSLAELHKLAPKYNWKEYFNSFLPVKIDDDEPIIVDVPKYIREVVELVAVTPNRTLANYLMWRVVLSSLNYLDTGMRKIRMNYVKALTGQERETARWDTCVSVVSGSLGAAVGSLYVRHFFDRKSKQTAQEIMDELQSQFKRVLQKSDWMDEQTRVRALDKAEKMTRNVAYPDEILNNTILVDFYQNLTTNNLTYYYNVLFVKKFSSNYHYSKLRKPVIKNDWVSKGQAAVVNAFYNPLENSITFPAGILQGIFFDGDRPNYLNFGAIGFVIGHEITHGFDDMGRQFDSEGNLKGWWQPETDTRFKERARCIIEQYGNYTVPEVNLKVNGINTQGENIADVGGLKSTYTAYEGWVRRNGEEALLPGLQLSTRQMFWLSAANVWCGKQRKEVMAVRVLTDSHSPGRFRVNGPLSNLKEFSEDFSCPSGSPMNPVQKCSMW